MSIFVPKGIIISEYIIQRAVCQEPRSFSLQKVKKRNKEWPMRNKPRNTDSSEFTQNVVGRDNWQKNESHPMLFHSHFCVFILERKHIELNTGELLLPCFVLLLSSIWKNIQSRLIFIHSVRPKEPRGEKHIQLTQTRFKQCL